MHVYYFPLCWILIHFCVCFINIFIDSIMLYPWLKEGQPSLRVRECGLIQSVCLWTCIMVCVCIYVLKGRLPLCTTVPLGIMPRGKMGALVLIKKRCPWEIVILRFRIVSLASQFFHKRETQEKNQNRLTVYHCCFAKAEALLLYQAKWPLGRSWHFTQLVCAF